MDGRPARGSHCRWRQTTGPIRPTAGKRRVLEEKARKKLAAVVQERRLKETLRVIDFLGKSGLEFAVLKGITLAYFDREREFSDIDILVARNDVEKAGSLLRERFGYRWEREGELDRFRKADDQNMHDITLCGEGLIPVEIHYRMFNYVPDGGVPVLAGRVFLDMDGVRIPCQANELQLLEVLMHNVYHHFFLCGRDKWVLDINTVIRNRRIDWNAFIRILAGMKQTETAYLAIRILCLGSSTGPDIPAEVVRRLRPASPAGYLNGRVFGWAFCFVRDRLFPPGYILSERFGLKPGSALFFLAYPANWLRLAGALALMPLKRKP